MNVIFWARGELSRFYQWSVLFVHFCLTCQIILGKKKKESYAVATVLDVEQCLKKNRHALVPSFLDQGLLSFSHACVYARARTCLCMCVCPQFNEFCVTKGGMWCFCSVALPALISGVFHLEALISYFNYLVRLKTAANREIFFFSF